MTRFLDANRHPLRSKTLCTSLERQGVHQAALGPGRVQAAIELQRARLADIALEDFAVIATRLDRLQHPLVVEAEPRSEIARRAEQPLDGRDAAGLRHLVRIASGDAEFFRLDQAEMQ